jgi:hypothetical protein
MSFADDIASDYELMDGVETITFTPRGGSAVTGVSALREPITRQTDIMQASIGHEQRGTIWNLWPASAVGMASADVKPGATITEAGGTAWRVVSASKETLSTRWRCICVEEAT